MRSKTDFYRLFFEQLARRGFDVKRSQSSDYIADIYVNVNEKVSQALMNF